MDLKLKRGARRSRYRLHKQTVEPVFGQIKAARGFRRFLLRGYHKVRDEWAALHRPQSRQAHPLPHRLSRTSSRTQQHRCPKTTTSHPCSPLRRQAPSISFRHNRNSFLCIITSRSNKLRSHRQLKHRRVQHRFCPELPLRPNSTLQPLRAPGVRQSHFARRLPPVEVLLSDPSPAEHLHGRRIDLLLAQHVGN